MLWSHHMNRLSEVEMRLSRRGTFDNWGYSRLSTIRTGERDMPDEGGIVVEGVQTSVDRDIIDGV